MTERKTLKPGMTGKQGSLSEIASLIPPDHRKRGGVQTETRAAIFEHPFPLTLGQRMRNRLKALKNGAVARATAFGTGTVMLIKGKPGAWRLRGTYLVVATVLLGLFAVSMMHISYPEIKGAKMTAEQTRLLKHLKQQQAATTTVTVPDANGTNMEFILETPSYLNMRKAKRHLKDDGTRKCPSGATGWKLLNKHDVVFCGNVLESDSEHRNTKNGG